MKKLMDKHEVIIDSDFFNNLTIISKGQNKEEKTSKYFIQLMDDMCICPVFHPFVYEEELHGNCIARELVEAGYIKKYEYDDFIKDQAEDMLYNITFGGLFNDMNGCRWDSKGKNARSYRGKKQNLGEIHSAMMSDILKIPIVLSNDKNAKSILARKIRPDYPDFNICSLYDFFMEYCKLEMKQISLKAFKILARKRMKEESYQEIRSEWIKQNELHSNLIN